MKSLGLLPQSIRSITILFIVFFSILPNVSRAQVPVNDDCSGAIVLGVDTVCHYDTFNNYNATASIGVPSPGCGFYQGGDVWFKATVPSSGNIRLEVRGITGINAQFAIYTDSCAALSLYSCNQLNPDRTISDPALAGKDIFIRVYKYNNASGGVFRICVWEPPVPMNNHCADAIMLNVDTACNMSAYTNAYATGQPTSIAPNPTCGFYRGGDVWFKFVAPSSGVFRIEKQNAGANAQYAVYSGSCGSFTQIMCAQLDAGKTVVNPSVAGDTLYLRVWNYNSEEGGGFNICVWEPDIPINDDCADAIMLNVDTACSMSTFTNAYATGQPTSIAPNPTCGFYRGGDVWFKFVAPTSGIFRVEKQNLGANAQYAVYSGSCGSFSQIMCAQLDAGKTVINPSVGGDTLYLRVYNYNNDEGGGFGICIWEPEIPVNDDCDDAILLNVDTVCNMSIFTNAYASAQPTSVAPNPTCGFYRGGDVWFKFVMPSSGNLRVEKQNLGANAQYAVYSGSCGSFTQLFCAQLDAGRTYIDTSVAGDTLYLRVYNYNNDEGGGFGICVWEPPVPVNNQCANALPLTVGASCDPDSFTNRYATKEAVSIALNPTCGFYRGGDVWFTLQMPASGKLTIKRQNLNGVNAQYALYTGTCGSFSQLACAQLSNTMNFNDSSYIGQTLYLRVYGYNTDEGGEFTLCAYDPSPVITAEPSDTSICQGNNASFSIIATNATSYQWQEDDGNGWSNISNGGVYSGVTSATLILTSPTLLMSNYEYRCIATGTVLPAATSTSASLIVLAVPQFTVVPLSDTGYTSTNCNSVLNYNVNVIGATNTAYSFSGATIGNGSGTGTGNTFNAGLTNITVTAWNICDSVDTTFSVVVIDTTSPTITCPSSMIVNTDSGLCTASNIILSTPSVFDACGIDTIFSNAPLVYPLGNTVVIITAKDNFGNSSSCAISVTVTDTQSPIVNAGSNQTFNADPTGCTATNVILPTPTVTDNCTVDSVWNNAPTAFPLGNTTVTVTARDASGNTSSDSYNVNVLDTTPPTINAGQDFTVPATGNCTVSNSGINWLSIITFNDNCSIDTTYSNATSLFSLGANPVVWTTVDGSGNTATDTVIVTVIDTTSPVITCLSNITINADNGSCVATNVSLGTPTVNDNCSTTVSNNAPSSYSVGTTSVVWTVTDGSSNFSSCTQMVTVVDNQVPNAICKNHTLTLVNGVGSISVSDIDNGSTDNCGIASRSLSKTTFTTADIGNNTVTLTVIDVNGNTSTCTATVTVQGTTNQLECSIMVTPANNTYTGGNPNNIYIGYGSQSVTLTGNATGGSGYNYSWSGSGLSCNNCQSPSVVPQTAGTYVFTLTVTDNTNATTTCTIDICVKDITVPGKKNKNKVYICHKGKTLNISKNAVNAHLTNHTSDFLGKCNNNCNSSAKGARNEDDNNNPISELTRNKSIKVYPNPSSGIFKIELSEQLNSGDLIVVDLVGRVVKKLHFDEQSDMTISLNDAPDGVYIIEVRSENFILRERILLER